MDRKYSELKVRITDQQKSLFENAAANKGQTTSEFVTRSAQRAAEEVIRGAEHWELDAVQSRALADALLTPKRANKRLRCAVNNYRKTVKLE